jgi:ATP-dependent protease HslVU (ClpYQ) peptidase subunit
VEVKTKDNEHEVVGAPGRVSLGPVLVATNLSKLQ